MVRAVVAVPKEATVESVVWVTATSPTRSIVEMNIERSVEMSVTCATEMGQVQEGVLMLLPSWK